MSDVYNIPVPKGGDGTHGGFVIVIDAKDLKLK